MRIIYWVINDDVADDDCMLCFRIYSALHLLSSLYHQILYCDVMLKTNKRCLCVYNLLLRLKALNR